MKTAVSGFGVVQDLPKSQRGPLVVGEFRHKEAVAERELRRFLAGEIPFSECQFVPARYRVFEDPKFYDPPITAKTVPQLPVVTAEDEATEEIASIFFREVRVVEGKPSSLGWRWLDGWGDLQPAW